VTINTVALTTIIRHATQTDLPALEWDGELTRFRRLYAEAYERAEAGDAVIWVAELPGGGVVGQLFVSFRSGRPELSDGLTRAYIYGVRVRSTYRNQGIGTHLMHTVEADLARRGFRYATLNVGRENPDACRFYERLGYRVVAPEPGRWTYEDENGICHEVHEPAWRMEKPLLRPHPSEGTIPPP
jgi:ribosomal protein S18 acetylase RimI-like enzyme